VCVCVDYGAWVFVLFTLLRPKPCAPRQPTDTMISYAFFTARSEQQWEGLRAEEAGKKRRNGEKEKEKEKERTKERGMGVKGKSWITEQPNRVRKIERERTEGGEVLLPVDPHQGWWLINRIFFLNLPSWLPLAWQLSIRAPLVSRAAVYCRRLMLSFPSQFRLERYQERSHSQ